MNRRGFKLKKKMDRVALLTHEQDIRDTKIGGVLTQGAVP
jgi:hypothetical protein